VFDRYFICFTDRVPRGKCDGCSQIGVLIDMNEHASFFDISSPISIMPESKSMIVIVHDPCWYVSIFEKNKMLQSFTSNDRASDFSLDHCFISRLYIIESSLYQTWYNNLMVVPLIEIESIVGQRIGYDERRGVHEVCLWEKYSRVYSKLYFFL
jgi:hypothetical protein